MKKFKIVMSVIALAAVALLALTGCPQEADSQNSEAALTEIKVGGFTADKIPRAISKAQWDETEYLDDYAGAEYTATVVLTRLSDLQNAQIAVRASAGAKIKYGDAASTLKPEAFDTSSTRTLTNNGILYIQVTSEDDKTTVYYRVQIKTMNSVSTLNLVTVAGMEAELGTPGAAWNDTALAAGIVGISDSQKTNAQVAVTKTATAASVKIAKVTGAAEPSFGTASDTAAFTFADGDFLYIEVTAENGTDKSVYKLEVQIGRTATVSSIQIGQRNVENMGEPAPTAAGITSPGSVLMNEFQPAGGYTITVTPSDFLATLQYAKASGSTVPSAYTSAASANADRQIVFTQTFNEGDSLWLEVTAANQTTKLYYKIQVTLPMRGTIKYGSPEIKDSSEKFIDSLWNDSSLEVYDIVKIYPGDSAGYASPPITTGKAKALWDQNGLYVYVDVTDPTVSATAPTQADHTSDSVELFINEDGNTQSVNNTSGGYAGRGGQYRVGSHGEVSGDAPQLTLASGWAKADGTGYVVIFRGPWRYKVNYPLEDGKKIGFELQINACTQNGSREAVIVWNNIAHTNYQNVTDYGEATLDLAGNTLAIDAKDPLISAHPTGKIYTSTTGTADPLTVTAASEDSGTLTYQWYKNTANSYTGGEALTGATTASYTPLISATGTTYYWAAVTNTISDNGDGGNKAATIQSGIASVIVSSGPLVEKITAGGSNVPVYQFTPPAGSTWADYKKLTFSVMVAEQGSYDNTGCRAYIVGNYQASNFGSTGIWNKQSSWNDARLVNINNGATVKAILGEPGLNVWKAIESPIVMADIPEGQKDSTYIQATYYPADTATGPFYFGLGLTVNPNGNPTQPTITYYIKDIALVKADGTKLPADDLMGTTSAGASVGRLYCNFSTSGVTERVLEAAPVTP